MTQALQTTPALTPMMAQYWDVKNNHPDSLLMYRMGDFYELFFEDAVLAAQALDIALTKRGKHLDQDIPMCGIPVATFETYLARLIQKGFRVAICEQLEDPKEAKKRGYKALVRRDVVRIVTPGTLTEDSLLPAKASNYLGCLAQSPKGAALAYADISTGDFYVETLDSNEILNTLSRLHPSELILPDTIYSGLQGFLKSLKISPTPLPLGRFHGTSCDKVLKEYFGVATLEGFGAFTPEAVMACGLLLDYITVTQKGQNPVLNPPTPIIGGDFLRIDASTRRNLELNYTLSGGREGALLEVMDKTLTGPGGRLLMERLNAPLLDKGKIESRLEVTGIFKENTTLRDSVEGALKAIPDGERLLGRLSMNRGGPRDLGGILRVLQGAAGLQEALVGDLPSLLHIFKDQLQGFEGLLNLLTNGLADTLPQRVSDGGFIRAGFNEELDELRSLETEGEGHMESLQSRYVQETGINTLKIKHNHVIGYHIEVGLSHSSKIPETFIHRQTLGSAHRYTTPELIALEQKINGAAAKAHQIEEALFHDLVTEVLKSLTPLKRLCRAIAEIDFYWALGTLAAFNGYTRPTLDDSSTFHVEGGRHPVVERSLKALQKPFVTNGCRLRETDRVWLITGPNMAGKSTYLRQNALIAIMAQMGSYVPASQAHIGMIDRVFSRVGAGDDLARGQSTFMVEMLETATILNQATQKSLVILDELGRGTSTFDGLSIAWAVVEHLHNRTKCRTLFATHYHELVDLAETLKSLTCHKVKVQEHRGDIVFLHEVGPGVAEGSYGIHVAKLAGVPRAVINRSQEILKGLETTHGPRTASPPLPLFEESKTQEPPKNKVLLEIEDLDPESLSPREALDLIYRWKEL